MEFQDRTLSCSDCHQEFVFTAGEQEFYDRKGFKEIPKRCKPCREARKNRRPDDRGGGGGGYEGNGNSRGAPARVPFRPAEGRPVYCRDCYANRSTGSGY
jgi:CxxC-x17-CxxC domain-containing protein